jgi:hypothetical protein
MEREKQARESITGTGQRGSERPLYTACGTLTNMESLLIPVGAVYPSTSQRQDYYCSTFVGKIRLSSRFSCDLIHWGVG